MRKKKTEDLANRIFKLRSEGRSISEVAEICCRSYALVSYYSRVKSSELNTKLKSERCGARRRYSVEHVKKVKAGITVRETAELLGLSVSSVRNYLKE